MSLFRYNIGDIICLDDNWHLLVEDCIYSNTPEGESWGIDTYKVRRLEDNFTTIYSRYLLDDNPSYKQVA